MDKNEITLRKQDITVKTWEQKTVVPYIIIIAITMLVTGIIGGWFLNMRVNDGMQHTFITNIKELKEQAR